MHRYSAAGGSSGVGNNTVSGVPRDTARQEITYSSPSSFPSTSRRTVQLTPYKLKCEREPLSSRLGPPDFHLPTSSCAEESLGREACQSGYKEAIDGIEESKETSLTLATTSSYWAKTAITRYKESIQKRLRSLNNALVRKRKAGQVYGVPLSGPLLTKPGQFPEQRPCGEDTRKKWIEDLALHKRLKFLAEHVPHGLRKRSVFEALIKNEVPLLRANWFIKVMYLNQVRPLSIGISAGGPDKSQAKRVELWTKDVIEYTESILNELCHHGTSTAIPHLGLSNQQTSDFTQTNHDGEEPSLEAKWSYMVRLIQLHYSEGLLQCVQLVDWVIKQLQERVSIEALELLLPMVLDVVDSIILSQTYVRALVYISIHRLKELCPSNILQDISEQPHKLYIVNVLTELLRYLIVSVPDTFVAFDCFPLPSPVCGSSDSVRSVANLEENGKKAVHVQSDCKSLNIPLSKELLSSRELTIIDLVESIQKRAASLAKAVNPGVLRNNEAKVVQSLDMAVSSGDVLGAYHLVFDEDFCSLEQLPDEWLAEVNPLLKFDPDFSASLDLSEIYAVRFLCEWAICDFRDCRRVSFSADRKCTAPKEMSRVYMAVSVLWLRMDDMRKRKMSHGSGRSPSDVISGLSNLGGHVEGFGNKKKKRKFGGVHADLYSFLPETIFPSAKGFSLSAFFESPGPIHDIIFVWLDQHELCKGEGFESLQLLLLELVRKMLFWPPAYVRQLIVSGLLERKETAGDVERAAHHRRLLQHLPDHPGLDFDEGKCGLDPIILEGIRLYRNERCFALSGCGLRNFTGEILIHPSLHFPGEATSNLMDAVTTEQKLSLRHYKSREKGKKAQQKKLRIMELKQAISSCLHFPEWCLGEEIKLEFNKSSILQGALKCCHMPLGNINMDSTDATFGCEECGKRKKQKANEGIPVLLQGLSVSSIETEEMWWGKKMPKSLDSIKSELPVPVKPSKQAVRGRPKTTRKLSLAQLAPARIEGSQVASSSHTCEAKVHCPQHKSVEPSMACQTNEAKKAMLDTDLRAIVTGMRGLRLGEKRLIADWLNDTIRYLVNGGEKPMPVHSPTNITNFSVTSTADERISMQWQLGDEQLEFVLFVLDVAMDFPSIVKLLLWLLPKAVIPTAASPGQSRGISMIPWKRESAACGVCEAAIVSSLRRYEGVFTAMNLLPEVLSVGMSRVATVMAAIPGGRAACFSCLSFIRDLYKRYGSLLSLQMWEKSWKASNDQRLIAELEALKVGEIEPNFGLLGITNSGLTDDRDDIVPPRPVGRLARIVPNMKDIVQRGINGLTNKLVTQERQLSLSGGSKELGSDRWDEGFQAAQLVVIELLEYIKQNAGSPQGDLQLTAAAISAVVSNAGGAAAIVFDSFGTGNSFANLNSGGICSSLKCTRRVLDAYVHCLWLLKEASGDRQQRLFDLALAREATSLVASALGHSSGRSSRPQFQLSPETPDPNASITGDMGTGSSSLLLGRSTMVAATIAALVVRVILNGISGLDRMISVFRVREGLEAFLLSKNSCTNPNGVSCGGGGGTGFKGDTLAETCVFWFRVLVGDCRPVAGGLVSDILGDASILAFSRIQRLMPLTVVFPPAYALFLLALRRQHSTYREDVLIQQTVPAAVADLMLHDPFRDVCLQDTRALYLLLSHTSDCEYANLLDLQGLDVYSKIVSMVPLRSRLFLHAILDRNLPVLPDDGVWIQGHGEAKGGIGAGSSQMEQLVQVLDDLQPATFHWQWVELRLLLNEQVFIEKLDGQNMSAAEAMQAVSAGIENGQLSESEKTFTEVVLTRLLVRPDAASLYSEVVHLLGRSLEDYLILQVKWVLENSDMLLGRKSLQQQLEKIAHRRGFKVGIAHVKSWGWLPRQISGNTLSLIDHDKAKHELASLEEGEVDVEGVDWRGGKQKKVATPGLYDSNFCLNRHFCTEKALANLVLPCLANSSNDTCSGFASELVKQMSNLEQQINLTRTSGKLTLLATTGAEATLNKAVGPRKGGRGVLESGSPGIGRRFAASVGDTSPPSAAALQTSMWLRLQFLLPLLPIIHADRESTGRNMRQTLAPVLLRLLGTRIVQEAAEPCSLIPVELRTTGQELEWNAEAASTAAAAAAAAGEGLFDRMLSVLYALLSSSWAVWLKPKLTCKGVVKHLREVPPFDRETAERMQVELEHMQLPPMDRVRLQAAMPFLPQTPTLTISAGPPQVPVTALPVLQNCVFSTNSSSSLVPVGISQKPPFRIENSMGKGRPQPLQEPEVEVDPWTLLEEGTGSSGTSGGSGAIISGENGSLKACSWLKGAVRVRRTDLTYVGAMDDDT